MILDGCKDIISIHTLTKRVTFAAKCQKFLTHISIHTLTKRVTAVGILNESIEDNFNPHSHKESDPSFFYFRLVSSVISIHTLTKRVTYSVHIHHSFQISIHTLTKRVTLENPERSGARKYFNPHSHKESDLRTLGLPRWLLHFNPHSHKESDRINLSTHFINYISIHTLTKRVTGNQSWLEKST